MKYHHFGVTHAKPTREQAEKMDTIAREEGADGFTECNLMEGTARNVNNGRYEGWFTLSLQLSQDRYARIRRRILTRIKDELGITIY